MRFTHSLSTRPLSIQLYDSNTLMRLIGNICYYALSLAYLKRLNLEVVLYTDTLGKALLSYLPYDKIYTTLDNIPDDLSPRFWASGKIYAIEQEPLGSVHIDGDVFIKKQSLVDTIKNTGWDLIVLNYEDHEWCAAGYYREFPFFKNEVNFCKLYGIDPIKYGAYNCGILGFKNQELKDKFIETYKAIALNHSNLHYNDLLVGNHRTPDLITELTSLYLLSKNYKVKLLLDPKKDETFKNICDDLGYQHVITMNKFNCLDKCLDTLKWVSPEIYEKTYKLCRNILNKLK